MTGYLIIAGLVAAVWALSRAGRMNPQQARKFAFQIGGWLALVVSGFLILRGNLVLGMPLLAIGAAQLGFQNLLSLVGANSQGASQGEQGRTKVSVLAMDRNEALRILGLQHGASEDEINAAWRRLQRANHPDAGGSDYLAAQINQARETLLKR